MWSIQQNPSDYWVHFSSLTDSVVEGKWGVIKQRFSSSHFNGRRLWAVLARAGTYTLWRRPSHYTYICLCTWMCALVCMCVWVCVVCVCVCVCVRARARLCVCVCVCVSVRAHVNWWNLINLLIWWSITFFFKNLISSRCMIETCLSFIYVFLYFHHFPI